MTDCRCGHPRHLHDHDHDRTRCALSTCDCRAYRHPRRIGPTTRLLTLAALGAAYTLGVTLYTTNGGVGPTAAVGFLAIYAVLIATIALVIKDNPHA